MLCNFSQKHGHFGFSQTILIRVLDKVCLKIQSFIQLGDIHEEVVGE